jgi:sugar (pentulose or hexulose) kinase
MGEPLREVPADTLVAGFDFSTGGVKGLVFDLAGQTVARVRLPTDLWTEGGVSELNVLQLEGQVYAAVRGISGALREQGILGRWRVCGISATHHTAGRLDGLGNPVRRAICWNDQTLAGYHAVGLQRLGGQGRARELTGGPWAVRYTLSHLVKDEVVLSREQWQRTRWIVPHGPLAAGYMTGRFDRISVSSAASTGMMDLRTERWRAEMLEALANEEYRRWAWGNLPRIVGMDEPLGVIAAGVAASAGLAGERPVVLPTLDDQAAGLLGGGAVEAGEAAIILGNSAVVNSSAQHLPSGEQLDAMKLNWGRYLWMRCYTNGALFVDRVVGPQPDWGALEEAARQEAPLCHGVSVLPFLFAEPSLGVTQPCVQWWPAEPSERGRRVRAAFEALAYLIALGVQAHEAAGQQLTRLSVSGGLARSDLLLEILASVLNRPLDRLVSDEGSALGAAVAALAGWEQYLRRQRGRSEPYTIADAAAQMVRFRDRIWPRPEWVPLYQSGLRDFERRLEQLRGASPSASVPATAKN